jgi:hypothetical protein
MAENFSRSPATDRQAKICSSIPTGFAKNVHRGRGCQMVCFPTKNPNLGKFWRALQLKMLVYFMDIRSILRSFGKFYGRLVYFVVIWYMFSHFGIFTKKNLATLTQTGVLP